MGSARVVGADPEGALAQMLNDLESLRRLLRLYPASHPALQPTRERIRTRVLALGGDGEVAVLSFGPDQLFWNGEKVSLPAAAPAVRLVTVADTFDLLFTARGGRGMLTREGTEAWLADRQGSMLDPGWVSSAPREVLQRPSRVQPPG